MLIYVTLPNQSPPERFINVNRILEVRPQSDGCFICTQTSLTPDGMHVRETADEIHRRVREANNSLQLERILGSTSRILELMSTPPENIVVEPDKKPVAGDTAQDPNADGK